VSPASNTAVPSFAYTALESRVVFGTGTIRTVAEEVSRLGCRRALVISTPGHRKAAENVAAALGNLAAGVVSDAAMHTPVDVTERVLTDTKHLNGDCLVAIGGGSAIGLSKAIALRTGLPQIAIPTTYAGSEATPIIGETRDGRKTTHRTLVVLPKVIIYDVDLTLTLSPMLSVTSGLNAIAHGAEALYAQDANPVISLLAEQGISNLATGLPGVVISPTDHALRSQTMLGAWLCGVCLGSVGMSLHHKLCHVLGGTFNLPHAETHAVMIPYCIAFNAPAAPAAMTALAHALKARTAVSGLWRLARDLKAPRSLREVGMKKADLDHAADIAVANPYWNPRTVERSEIRTLLEYAFAGRAPDPLA
jgi:alcohol dehydrogenase class IV